MNQQDKTQAYIWNLASQISDIVDALGWGEGYYSNPVAKSLGIDYGKDFSKYWDYLYALYDMAEAQGLLNDTMLEDLPKFQEIADERADEVAEKAHEDIMYSVQEGDKVRLSNGDIFYVVSIDGNDLWVSNKPGDPNGWYADLHDVVEILE